MQPGELTDALTTPLLTRARRVAHALRQSALHAVTPDARRARERQAETVDELIRYAEDRDRALAERVDELARLRRGT